MRTGLSRCMHCRIPRAQLRASGSSGQPYPAVLNCCCHLDLLDCSWRRACAWSGLVSLDLVRGGAVPWHPWADAGRVVPTAISIDVAPPPPRPARRWARTHHVLRLR
ncbi:hypothetical protein BDA96_03G325100 [Sorghum bicolor]|uniref:Uncharacterized protein n=2 Tax=Sorghum bicolor TaxID=4558 RepID=A0A921RHK6_SORBI|nr:hypothetical protein BDA96_03G325100 [Sorghum bicolor]KXG33407.1 hypothetical protein SORBI_3003G301100 [Sorghum bicolor]